LFARKNKFWTDEKYLSLAVNGIKKAINGFSLDFLVEKSEFIILFSEKKFEKPLYFG